MVANPAASAAQDGLSQLFNDRFLARVILGQFSVWKNQGAYPFEVASNLRGEKGSHSGQSAIQVFFDYGALEEPVLTLEEIERQHFARLQAGIGHRHIREFFGVGGQQGIPFAPAATRFLITEGKTQFLDRLEPAVRGTFTDIERFPDLVQSGAAARGQAIHQPE